MVEAKLFIWPNITIDYNKIRILEIDEWRKMVLKTRYGYHKYQVKLFALVIIQLDFCNHIKKS